MISRFRRSAWLGLIALFVFVPLSVPQAADKSVQADPWPALRDALLGEGPILQDRLVFVVAPKIGEDAAAVPVKLNFSPELGQVKEILVIAENNPFPLIARIEPNIQFISFSLRIRMEKSGPIRAAVRTEDGIWHVAQRVVKVTGGGCSVAGAAGSQRGRRHGQVNATAFVRMEGSKLRFQLVHPMSTGLAKDKAGNQIPPDYIREIDVRAGEHRLFRMDISPISTNPTFTVKMDVDPAILTDLVISAVDTNGERYASEWVMMSMEPGLELLLQERNQANLSSVN